MALTNGFSIITGGPGTGKTMIQRAIIDIYRKINASKSICCCAPTGRAARRMEESTRQPASTVHKALGLMAGEDGAYDLPEELRDDLILVDEVSNLDIYLAKCFFDAIKKEAQVVFIGDADQLPSVGPGAVLSEMINSGCIPIARLDKVFRQIAGSRIAINAKLIGHGNLWNTARIFCSSTRLIWKSRQIPLWIYTCVKLQPTESITSRSYLRSAKKKLQAIML